MNSTTYRDALIEANDATESLNNSYRTHIAHTDSKQNDNKTAVLTNLYVNMLKLYENKTSSKENECEILIDDNEHLEFADDGIVIVKVN